MWGQHPTSLVSRNFKLGDDGNGLDFRSPRELDVVANAERRLRGLHPSVLAACRSREHFTEGDLCACHVFGFQGIQIGTHKAAEESCANVVGVTFCSRLSEIRPSLPLSRTGIVPYRS